MNIARTARLNRHACTAGVWLFSILLLIWTMLPLYNMVRVSLQEKEDVLSTYVWPLAPRLTASTPSSTRRTGC